MIRLCRRNSVIWAYCSMKFFIVNEHIMAFFFFHFVNLISSYGNRSKYADSYLRQRGNESTNKKKTAKIIFVQNLFHKEVAHVTLCHILSSCFLYLTPTGARSAKVIQAQKKEEEDERIKWKILIALFT